jgi:hypothetical protein
MLLAFLTMHPRASNGQILILPFQAVIAILD